MTLEKRLSSGGEKSKSSREEAIWLKKEGGIRPKGRTRVCHRVAAQQPHSLRRSPGKRETSRILTTQENREEKTLRRQKESILKERDLLSERRERGTVYVSKI